jgi:hypothetical protein
MPLEGNDPDNLFIDENLSEEKIAELELKIKTLKLKKDLQAGFIKIAPKEKWKTVSFITLIIILCVLPPLFIVLDRWLHVNQFVDFSKDSWCKVEFFCSSLFPPYFGWVFFLSGLTVILMILFAPKFYGKIEPIIESVKDDNHLNSIRESQLALRKPLIIISLIGLVAEIVSCILLKRIPGMELLLVILLVFAAIVIGEKEIGLIKFTTQIQGFLKKAPLYGTMIFSQLALIMALKEITSFTSQKNYLYFLPLIFAIVTLIWQRKKINKMFWLFTLAVVLFSFKMSSWNYSFVGDEYSFYFYPNQVIAHQTFPQIAASFFNIKGVYDVHPYFSSLFAYVNMLFFGDDYFGWHLSNILLMAFTIPMFYEFFKSFLHERVALLAVIPLAFSHYLVNFSKIGYNNLQALFAMCLILWVANKASKQRSFSMYFLLGISLGACFYTFPLGIFTIPLVGLFLLMFDPPRSKAVWARYSLAILGLLIILIPIFFQPTYWSGMAGNTIFFEKHLGISIFSSVFEVIKHITSNLLYTSFAYLLIPTENHFIVSSLIDPLLGVFLPLGFLLSIINFRKNKVLAFLALSYVFEILIMSISNPYDSPPLTRMFLFIPFYFVFAALGLDWITRVIAGITYQPGKLFTGIVTCVLILSGLVNMIQSTLILAKRTDLYPIQSVILRLFQHDATAYPKETKTYLFLTEKDFGFYFFETFVDVFHTPESKAQIQQLIVDSPNISDNWLERMKEEDVAIIVSRSMQSSLFDSLQPLLQQTGKVKCEVTTTDGKFHYYQLWYPQKYPDMCDEALSLQ